MLQFRRETSSPLIVAGLVFLILLMLGLTQGVAYMPGWRTTKATYVSLATDADKYWTFILVQAISAAFFVFFSVLKVPVIEDNFVKLKGYLNSKFINNEKVERPKWKSIIRWALLITFPFALVFIILFMLIQL